jgi:hypothetical protein
MLRSAQETASKEKLSRRKPAREAGKQTTTTNKEEEQEDNSKGEFGIQGDFNSRAEELMSKSS